MAGMSDSSLASTAVDLSRLPAPAVVEQIDYEAIRAALIADLQARWPAFDATLESEPVVKLIEVFAYREMTIRQQFNDRARQVMTAFATGSNLDQLAALVGVDRLVVDAGDPDNGVDPTYEEDDALRARIVLAPESFSVAGPEGAYRFHALSADGRVLDASAVSPTPGYVIVSVLSREGDGTAPPDLIAAVEAVVNGREVRPLTDFVAVQSAEIIGFAVNATIWTFAGPDTSVVLAAARAQLDAYLADSRRLGRDITMSGLLAALTVPGVQRVELAAPATTLNIDRTQAAWCTGVTVAHGGYAD